MGSLAIAVSAPPQATESVNAMLAAAPHRGSQVELRSVGEATIGISTDADDRDAWLAASNGSCAAFVGSLDNVRELAQIFGATVSAPAEIDPAGVLLRAFSAWGTEAFNRLRGVFSAVVVDGSEVHCARDHLGLRPLYYRRDGDEFFVATEAKQVAAGSGISREPDVEAIEDLFYGRLTPETAALKGISRLPRASVASVSRGKVSSARYWNPRALLETASLSPSETLERLAELLERVVERSVTGRDAVSLSGGIDSPTIAALAAPQHERIGGRPLQALSSVYPAYPTVDERRYTELVADYLGLPLETYEPSAQPLDQAQLWVDRTDGPSETLSLPELAENYTRARLIGARTVLTGELAEWVFTFGAHLIGHFILHGRVRPAAAWLREQRTYAGSWRQVARIVAPSLTPPLPARLYLNLRGRSVGQAPPWIDPAQTGDRFRPDLARPTRRRWLEHQVDPLLSPAATSFDADEICAAHCGIHVKRPLADIDLWEFLLSLPAERKFPNSVPKALIRDVMRGRLPDEILDRKDKTGFSAWVLGTADWSGLRRWLRDPDPPISGVNYPLLLDAIDRRRMGVLELMWAYDLARVHAFLDLWR